MLATETTYVKNLELIFLVYVKYINEAYGIGEDMDLKLLPLPALKNLFVIIKMLWQINFALWKSLSERILNWSDSQVIGDVLKDTSPYLKSYIQYSPQYDAGISELKKTLAQDSCPLKTALDKGMAHPLIKGNTLESYLILPIQRVPRYVMLLTDLINHTPPEHPDHQNLSESLRIMKEVGQKINEAILENERRMRCIEVSSLIIGGEREKDKTFEKDIFRVLILQSTVTKQCHNKTDEREIFLFNDYLVCCKILPSKKYEVRQKIELQHATAEAVEDETGTAFVIKSNLKSFVCYAKNPAEKKNCIAKINDAVNKQRIKLGLVEKPQTDLVAVWEPDSAQDYCSICKREFTVVRRRHHCRNCGLLIDGDCSRKRYPIHPNTPPVRVCDNCVPSLEKK
uniref:FYVE-type domain-containing protein n=1 Tax=Arcella intermedia TaxID=1963864 RepID=A0A6B2L5V1_9EUKA